MNAQQSSEQLQSVEAALQSILAQVKPTAVEPCSLMDAPQRVLAEPVVSPANVPPFVNSAMDGYAVIAADVQAASKDNPLSLAVIDNIPAGVAPTKPVLHGQAARIMTGAPLPDGADAVIRFEETSEYIPSDKLGSDEVRLYQSVESGSNVRFVGEDIQQGQQILPAGHRLRPQDIGVLAAIGQATVRVYKRPRVAILATGDELVALDEPLTPGKIRNSNEYTTAALVQKYGGQPIPLGIAGDTVEDLTAKIRSGLAQNVDLFVTSAGVSVGDFDVVKTVLAAEGNINFWQVAIKPGKPLAFGKLNNGVPLIGLPGNPVAAMVTFEVFVRPALLKLAGCTSWERPTVQAILDEDVYNSGRRHYMRSVVRLEAGQYRVTTRDSGVKVQGSGILTSLVWANSLVVVPENVTHLPAGETVSVWLLE